MITQAEGMRELSGYRHARPSVESRGINKESGIARASPYFMVAKES
jgi:hypothetical protein